ncbi:uncharacterized protein LOC115728833 isoform X2 [Rhodamnia argentea]|uniref:Uncharacterized protein LOC115728833 isoform X2 n=1 Tax=Rhodamnia argentea TaxID=178133 RepID=A0A8B8MYA9_9MYRT|nr:uncharacterized protein LOC115728833 isoform X2 [Rhodamnia argentea]
MESPCDSTKRKRPSSSLFSPLFNLFTRSETPPYPSRKLPRRNHLPDVSDDSSHVFIKDLRSRRVFSLSPKPKSSGSSPDRGEREFEKPDSLCGDEGEAPKDDVDTTLSSIVREYCSEKDGGMDLYKDDDDDEMSGEEGLKNADFQAERDEASNEESNRIPPDSPQKVVAATETAKGLDDSGDDCVQTTPPEATDVILGLDVEENGGNCDLQRADRISVEPLQGSSLDEGSGGEISKRNDSASKSEPGLNPHFRLRRRIYKRPGSISYRRLLPYLTDRAMEDSCTTRVSESLKHEKGMEERPPHLSISSSYKDIPMDESSEHGSDKPATEAVPLVMLTADMPHDPPKDINYADTPATVNEDLGDRAIDGQIGGGKLELIMQGSTLCAHSKVGTYTDVGKEKGEAEVTEGRLSGMADDLNSVKSVSSLTEEESIVDQCFHERKHPMDGGMKRFQLISQPNSSSRENGHSFFAEKTRGSDCGEAANQMIDTNEARLLFSSSDSGIFGEQGVNEIEGNKIKFVTARANGAPQNSPSNTSKVGYSFPDNSTKSKMVLNPCSRLKVFKNPSSFSYKRMLPYLKEIAKDDSCNPGNGQCLKLLTRSKEESSSPPVLSDSENSPTDKCNGDRGSADHNISSPESLAHGTCLQKDEDILAKHLIKSTDSEYESSYGIVNARDEGHLQPASPYSVAVHQLKEDSHTMLCQSSEHVGELCANSTPGLSSDAKEIGAEGPTRDLSQVRASDLFGFPDEVSRRGILKRNPRGCRGLCNCLTCASFRLNAERAFEFSRNQMKDAEETTSSLINQLSQLRSIVEKINCGVSNLALLQVREACRRASEAEELAKHRLSQMNDELNIHCRVARLHRPRVKFSDSTENGTFHEELESKVS